MIWTIIVVLFSIIIGFTLLWYFTPAIKLGQDAVSPYVDQDDPAIALATSLGNGWYLVLGFVGIFVAGFILITKAHEGDN